jgi:hypothetical protein
LHVAGFFCLAQLVQIGSHDTANNELTLNNAEVKKMWKGIYNEIASSAGISMDLACEWVVRGKNF